LIGICSVPSVISCEASPRIFFYQQKLPKVAKINGLRRIRHNKLQSNSFQPKIHKSNDPLSTLSLRSAAKADLHSEFRTCRASRFTHFAAPKASEGGSRLPSQPMSKNQAATKKSQQKYI
jgi:hypothetical protein